MNVDTSVRAVKLNKYLDSIIHGKQDLTHQNNALFLEAIYMASDAATCIHKLISSSKGLHCLQKAMRFDLTPNFFNGPATLLLQYLSNSELMSIGGGFFLQQVLLSIVEPPFFWTSFRIAFQAGQLTEKAQSSFAWLLFRLMSLPGEQAESYRELAEDSAILHPLLSSSCHDVRSIALQARIDSRGGG